ncbi:LOW QUALITY PROTEIN: CMT1A duplicated region transcript 1 protein-like [Haliotis rubra]|uniref:LOW QUALITY PROTEIN: CMT1A duplicated region transcript 1 protein-like n=1 Tax=Haliotis rubra TaxID=36100 RepID=UPI001EE569AC|nr:LOW QUALITY PROTEIN: CMT1A duplicated region transcript 1 protein-like [Haliotis rubra]
MLDVYNFTGSSLSSTMKHPQSNLETYEFNLGKAPELRCVFSQKATVCGKCETCELNDRLKYVKEWFVRFGDHSQKRFMLGLMRRIHSINLLQQLVTLLQPLVNKDFTYARTRTCPSLRTDTMTLSSDRSLSSSAVEYYITSTWDWFAKSNYWSKSNFALALLRLCDVHLLHILGTQARTLLISEENACGGHEDLSHTEASSVAASDYSFDSVDHRELLLLQQSSSHYDRIRTDPFTGESISEYDQGIINDDSGDETLTGSSDLSIDPACMVVSTSSKAYSGVSRYRDFIRLLPVHLSKYILSLLDRPSQQNALCVSQNWRVLIEEVHKEFYVNQQLWEEVMLMQGAAAQGVNSVYANDVDVIVPRIDSDTNDVIATDGAVIKTMFKSEINFNTAYSGLATMKVIMEERNVYCGAYNVMVICDQEDIHRVMHTDGGQTIALGSKDRKVRFIDCESGKEKGPVITGHAGSVRCTFLCEKKGIVLSGSYDTSVRCWSIETGQCLKIFRGHRDTVVTIIVHGETLATGSKDSSCKVWNLQTGKCLRTFRHRHPVLAVALSKDRCISGCESGRVKVWNVETGELIKRLSGHQGPVTAIKFDRWHIITGSKDGYALAWSALGKHSRCLQALRHPKEVLCLEFMFLRVITGSADGRLRIWNIKTGQCCRIMRGNSRSDPIHSIIALGDRITLNTHNNLLVLNFEKVDWDYSLETDKVPSLVQYSSYSDSPVRQQPYSYIRAQRMKVAGAANKKIINHDGKLDQPLRCTPLMQTSFRAPQIPHSAKTLSTHSMSEARMIQFSRGTSGLESQEWTTSGPGFTTDSRITFQTDHGQTMSPPNSAFKKPPLSPQAQSSAHSRTRPGTSKSGKGQPTVTILEQKPDDMEEEDVPTEPPVIHRRVSWAFDKPLTNKSKDFSLSEMKSLLRSQIRMKAESVIPPDFIYLTVNTIQNSMKPSETNRNTQNNIRDIEVVPYTHKQRPSSSPGKIDPRTKVPIEDLDLEQFIPVGQGETISDYSDLRSVRSLRTKEQPKPPPIPPKESIATRCVSTPINPSRHISIHPKRIKSTLPRGRVIRPISAAVMQRTSAHPPLREPKSQRPVTAPNLTRPITSTSIPLSIATALPGAPVHRPKSRGLTSSQHTSNVVPMLMYSKEVKDTIEMFKQRQKDREQLIPRSASEPSLGKVSPFNDPLRSHVRFELRTHKQEKEYINDIETMHRDQKQREEDTLEKKKRAAWLARVKSKEIKDKEVKGKEVKDTLKTVSVPKLELSQ